MRENDSAKGGPTSRGDTTLDLDAFVPYQLALLAEETSRAVAEIYSEQFALNRQEWRILAVLGARGELPAGSVGRATTLDKMQMSRALRSLEQGGIVTRSTDPRDRRNKAVRLTPKGRRLYRDIVPRVLERERHILSVFGDREAAEFSRLVSRLLAALRG